MKAADILEVATRALADDSRQFHTQPPQGYTWSTPVISALIAASIWCIFYGSGDLFFQVAQYNINPDHPPGWTLILDRIDASGVNLPLLAAGVAYIITIGAPFYRRAAFECITILTFTSSTLACIANYHTAAAITWYIHRRHPHTATHGPDTDDNTALTPDLSPTS